MVICDLLLLLAMLSEARLAIVEQVFPDLGIATVEFTYETRDEPYYEYVMLEMLPGNVGVGDVLTREGDKVRVDHEETQRRRRMLLEMYRNLPRGPKGDITL